MGDNNERLAELSINTMRFLAVDAIQKAKSGHPGLPMGGAAMAYTLWTRHLRHNPSDPGWADRDRFVLSAGHGSMLIYSLLYLTGYDFSLDDIKAFRVWGSKAPGHPEFSETPGVEVTTGPLGQGIGDVVGMAAAEAHLAARYNRDDLKIVDHYTYVIAGDGDLMEGISYEACSLAGHLQLGRLIVLYDDNRISLAGSTKLSFTEDVEKRFESAGWHVQHVEDGNDVNSIDRAISLAKEELSRPSIIRVSTIIGYGSPCKQDSASCHGSPLGVEEVAAAKENLGWPVEPELFVPEDVLEHMRGAVKRGRGQESEWRSALERYRETCPEGAAEFERVMEGKLPADWESALPEFGADLKAVSTRKVSEAVLQALAPGMPELMGGTADLNPSTLAWLKGFGDFQPAGTGSEDVPGAVGGEWSYRGQNVHFGVREHAMGAIANGMALHGGVIPFVGTFFVFSDYMRPSMRIAALMGARVIYVFSHDSIGVGEDGPTHQPVEHLMSLRSMPGLTVIRPADAAEAVEAWRSALLNDRGPTALVFSRQDIPILDRSKFAPADGLQRGGYTVWESSANTPDVILIGTGSELQIALDAGKSLSEKDGIAVRVVSLPCWEIFDGQPEDYREKVLPSSVKTRVAVEAGIKLGWEHYVGLDGAVIGMDGFGASAPASILYEKFGITVQDTIETVKSLMGI
ncbi:MAG: transketolase [Deltaproteobacteria bacterium]|nr:transketolase [Deltaproteobacteria bacterium]MBW2596193.1 transketolase [Deltaproteobacteria bacterium]